MPRLPRHAPPSPSRPRRLASLLVAGGFACVSAAGGPAGTGVAFAQGPAAAPAQAGAPGPSTQAPALDQARLEQMLAPIALYPDSLLMQVLMAATYPLEVVQAERWLGQDDNARLGGDALAKALEPQPWDPSVKSLVPFPDVLGMMNDKLDWTQALGDAVLAQQEDVLNAVQALRARAQSAGKLESGPQQVVTVTQNVTVAPPPAAATPAQAAPPSAPPPTRAAAAPAVPPPAEIIAIAPADPQTVYVPVYDPSVVYGTWPYPSYPPVTYPPPPGLGLGSALLTGMAFAGGVALAGSLWGWARPSWRGGYVDVDVNRYNSINVNRTQITSNRWTHDATHRRGVAYGDATVADRFRGTDGAAAAAASRDELRGRMDQARASGGGLDALRPDGGGRSNLGDRTPGDRPNLGDRTPGDRPNLGDRTPGDRPNLGDRAPGDRPNLGDRTPGDRPNAGDRTPGDRPNLGDRTPGDRPNLGDRTPGDRPNLGDRTPGDRPNTGNRTPGSGSGLAARAPTPAPATRPAPGGGLGDRSPPATRPSIAANGRPQVAARSAPARPAPQALQGFGQGADLRAAQQRGAASRATPVAGPRGGGGGGGERFGRR